METMKVAVIEGLLELADKKRDYVSSSVQVSAAHPRVPANDVPLLPSDTRRLLRTGSIEVNKLPTALDDLEGLLEVQRALLDEGRRSALRRSADTLKDLRREIAAATDAYATTLMASAGGDVSAKRLNRCRKVAATAMRGAVAKQLELADLVNQERLPSPALREDLGQLVTLSLECRAAVAALAPTVDRRAANALANKVLVELRSATLQYLSSARDSPNADTDKPRAAVVALLEKTEGHLDELVKLAPPEAAPEGGGSLGAGLSKHVVEMLHKTALAWKTAAAQAEQG